MTLGSGMTDNAPIEQARPVQGGAATAASASNLATIVTPADAARLGPVVRCFTTKKSSTRAGITLGGVALAYGAFAVWSNLRGAALAWIGLLGGVLASAAGVGMIYKFATLRNLVTIHENGLHLELGRRRAAVLWSDISDIKVIEQDVAYNGGSFRERALLVTTRDGTSVAVTRHHVQDLDELIGVVNARGR